MTLAEKIEKLEKELEEKSAKVQEAMKPPMNYKVLHALSGVCQNLQIEIDELKLRNDPIETLRTKVWPKPTEAWEQWRLGEFTRVDPRFAKMNEPVWVSNKDGNYWRGNTSKLNPYELAMECLTTYRDLVKRYPELRVLGEPNDPEYSPADLPLIKAVRDAGYTLKDKAMAAGRDNRACNMSALTIAHDRFNQAIDALTIPESQGQIAQPALSED